MSSVSKSRGPALGPLTAEEVVVLAAVACREPAYCILSAALATASSFRIWNSSTGILSLPGAGVRHSARGKGHEEGGSTYTKAGLSLRSPPENPQASTPITRACLLYYFALSPTPLTLQGAVPTTSFGEGVNLELQLIIIPGRDRSVLTYKLL